MQRLSEDRGAIAVVAAILMIPLLGMAAISLDIAGTYSERQQLQLGADAAALAVAQDCSTQHCGRPTQTAGEFVELNSNVADPAVSLSPGLSPSSGKVTVTVSATRQHWFAPVLGIDQSDIETRATAAWGAPTGGTAGLPLVISWCDFSAQTAGGLPSGRTERTILLPKKAQTGCNGPSGNPVPGGFGWIKQDPGNSCTATSRIGERVSSDTGNNQKCSTAQFAELRNRTVLLPITGEHGGNGNNAWYRVYAYAAFTVTGYFFNPSATWNASGCSSSAYCIKGYFTQLHERDPDFDYGVGAPDLGASAVYLLPD